MAMASPWNSRSPATPRETHPAPIPRADEHPTSGTISYPSRAGPAPYRHDRSGSNQECGDGQPPPRASTFPGAMQMPFGIQVSNFWI